MSEKIVPVFVPSLLAILINAEEMKGSPLNEKEVIQIRNEAITVTMKEEDAIEMSKSRGYNDIDPENCWYDWQMIRRELGMKPDLEAGIRIYQMEKNETKINKTINQARENISQFEMLYEKYLNECFPMIKFTFKDNNDVIHMWLLVEEIKSNSFMASFFELPNTFTSYQIGDIFEIRKSEILDWMINIEGDVYGGYSLRHQREQLNLEEKRKFDEQVGIVRFCN